jgi:hypothetical protein
VKSNFLDWERVGIGKNIAALCLACVIYFIVLFIWESRVWTKLPNFRNFRQNVAVGNSSSTQAELDGTGLEDSDVLEEKNKMAKTELTQLCKENTLVIRLVSGF